MPMYVDLRTVDPRNGKNSEAVTPALLVDAQGNALGTNSQLDARLWVWNTSTLTWDKMTQPGGVGGGGGGPATIADGADVAQGATTDVAVTGDNAGTLSAKLRGLNKLFANVWDSVNGRLKVDGSGVTQPVSAASLPLPTGASTESTLVSVLQTLQNNGDPIVVEPGAEAAGIGVGAAADVEATGNGSVIAILKRIRTLLGATLAVTGTVTANVGSTNGLALDATLTGGTQKAINRGGAKGTTSAADVTSTASGVNHQGLDVILYDASGNVLIGQKTMAGSVPVTIASDQGAVPVSGTVTANQGTANATPWNENVAQVGGTNVVTSIAGAQGIGGDTADGAADAGKSVKVGGKVVLNNAALPTALTASQRAPLMVDEYGRPRIVVNRPKILGSYKFESGRLTVQATAHASTAGFWWLINPVGSGVVCKFKKLFVTSVPTAVTAFASSPRITLERVTFTGTASGATITVAKRDSNDASNVCTVRTASTGLTLTAGAVIADFTVPAVLTAVGIAVPVDQWLYDDTDEDDYIILRAGEGLVLRQPDNGTTSDTRLVLAFGGWEES